MEKSKKFKFMFLTFFLLIGNQSVSALFGINFDNIKELVGWAYEVYGKVNEAYDAYGTFTADVSLDTIISEVKAITMKIDQLGVKIEQKIDSMMQTLLRRLPLIQQRNEAISKLSEYIDVIDRLYNNFENYLNHSSSINNVTMSEFADTVTSADTGKLPDVLWKIWRLIVPGYEELGDGLFMIVSKTSQENSRELCNTGLSAQQQIRQLYQRILTSEMKAYLMTLVAYGMKEIFSGEKFTFERMSAENDFSRKSTEYLQVLKQALAEAPRDIRRCDPAQFVRNESFLEFERYMQVFIVNEVDINRDRSCKSSCSTVVHTSAQIYGCYDSDYCPARTCKGEVVNCAWAGGPVTICEMPSSAVRHYEFFWTGNGLYGTETNCKNNTRRSFSGWFRFPVDCDYCMCTCIQDQYYSTDTIRTLSFREKFSDIEKNMVVTAVRFVSLYDMIHLQIMEAPLLPLGKVDAKLQQWTPIEKMEYDKSTSDKRRWAVFNVHEQEADGVKVKQMNLGFNYGMLNREQQQIQLDDIVLPDDYVLTGVRFKHAGKPRNYWDPKQFRLELHGTPFDYKTGQLIPTTGIKWFNSDNMPNRPPKYYTRSRKEWSLKSAGNPTLFSENRPDTEPNMYVEVGVSDFKSDAGQSTVPFFDAQQVGGKLSFPLSGVGLFHKGTVGSGGFLALRIFSLDLSKYIELPEEPEAEIPSSNEDYLDYDYDPAYV